MDAGKKKEAYSVSAPILGEGAQKLVEMSKKWQILKMN